MNTWNHKDSWQNRGKNFMVEVYHYTEVQSELSMVYCDSGPHRWNVYAYIYPKHPHFDKFDRGDGMWQGAASMLDFHGGPTFLAFPQFNDEVTCVKVGCDYNHLHDSYYTRLETCEDAEDVFADAQRLFDRLEAMEAKNEHAPTKTPA